MSTESKDESLGFLEISTGGKWAVMEMGAFFMDVTVLYNAAVISNSNLKLSTFKMMCDEFSRSFYPNKMSRYRESSYPEYAKYDYLGTILLYSYVGDKENLTISKMSMNSPGEMTLQGEKRSIRLLGELLRFAVKKLSRDDFDKCVSELLVGEGKTLLDKFISEFGDMKNGLEVEICKRITSILKLNLDEKIISIKVST